MEGEGIYLLREREFVRLNEDVYKIGRSSNIKNRMNNYPKSSNIELMIGCSDSVGVEKALLEIFRKQFKQMKEYGSEYFYGDKLEMIKIITNFINNSFKGINSVNNISSISSISSVNSSNEIRNTQLFNMIPNINTIKIETNKTTTSNCIGLYTNDMDILEYNDTLYWIDKNENIYEIARNDKFGNKLGKKIGRYDKKVRKIIPSS